jgi:hypothetical protein
MRRSAFWVALVAFGVMAAPSAACSQTATVCQESGKVTLSADSYGSQSTDTVPDPAGKAVIGVSPDSPPDAVPFDNLWFAIVDAKPNLKGIQNQTVQRFITCQLLAFALTTGKLNEMDVSVRSKPYQDATAATFFVCLALAFAEPPASQGRAASLPPCGAPVGVPVQISRSGRTYSVGAQGQTFKPRRSPLAVSCRRKGKGLVITVRSRRRGTRLRKLLGPHLTIGFANHTSSPVHFRTTYRFTK